VPEHATKMVSLGLKYHTNSRHFFLVFKYFLSKVAVMYLTNWCGTYGCG